jgi:hypothetical protein
MENVLVESGSCSSRGRVLIVGSGPAYLPNDHQHGPFDGDDGFGAAAPAGDVSVF